MAYLSIDKLEVTRALGIAVSGAVFCASLVARVLLHSSVLLHGDKVECSVEPAWEFGNIDIKCELHVRSKFEHLVIGIVLHKI